MLVLTDRELILIRDDEKAPRARDGMRYGGLRAYIPLGKIVSISLTDKDGDLLNLSIRLPHEDRIESLFAMSKREELNAFLKQIESLRP